MALKPRHLPGAFFCPLCTAAVGLPIFLGLNLLLDELTRTPQPPVTASSAVKSHLHMPGT